MHTRYTELESDSVDTRRVMLCKLETYKKTCKNSSEVTRQVQHGTRRVSVTCCNLLEHLGWNMIQILLEHTL